MVDIVVGIGNPYRGDDAAGWVVIDALAKKALDIPLIKQRGDVAELLDIFSRFAHVYLVDACIGIDAWQRIDVHQTPLVLENHPTSTHGFSLSQAIALAKNLSMLPKKIIIYAISGEQYAMSDGLSPSTNKMIAEVIDAILKEIHSCTKKV